MRGYHAILRGRPDAGFTMVELLVSSAVLAIVLTILLGTMTASLGIWRTTGGATAADREGRSANILLLNELRSAVVPEAVPELWPKVASNGTYLGFLLRKPAGYQDIESGEVGQVCFVEYLVESNALKRRFVGSRETRDAMVQQRLPTNSEGVFHVLATNIITAETAMRSTVVSGNRTDLAVISTNFIPVSRGWFVETNSTVVLPGLGYLPIGEIYPQKRTPLPSPPFYRIIGYKTNTGTPPTVDALAHPLEFKTNFFVTPEGVLPQAIEVNLAAADADTLQNRDVLANTNVTVRSPGFFHFRASLIPSP